MLARSDQGRSAAGAAAEVSWPWLGSTGFKPWPGQMTYSVSAVATVSARPTVMTTGHRILIVPLPKPLGAAEQNCRRSAEHSGCAL